MMMSPEGYYKMYLEGRTAERIMIVIRQLETEIEHLKNVTAHREYGSEPTAKPSESVRLLCNRMYLERAKEALAEARGSDE